MALVRASILLLLLLAAGPETFGPRSATELSLKDIRGKTVKLSSYRGRVLLLNFWATWCAPCRAEIPDLIKKQRLFRSQGLRIVGITYPPETISQVRAFVRRYKLNYPVLIGSRETKQVFTSSDTLPMTVVLDRHGKIREIIEGIMYSDEFEQKVIPIIVGSQPAGAGNKRQ